VKLSNPVHKLGLGNNADWCTICRDNLDLLLMLSQLPGFWDITTVGHLANEMANRRIPYKAQARRGVVRLYLLYMHVAAR